MWQIHYHMVMPVKYRKALIEERIRRVLKETTEGIEERYAIEMEGLGCDKDHVHLLCGAHPKMAPGRIVQIYKSITAREVFGRESWIKKELWGGEFWSDGYYVGTVGGKRRLGNGGTIRARTRKTERGTTAVDAMVSMGVICYDSIPRSLLRGGSLSYGQKKGRIELQKARSGEKGRLCLR